MDASSIGGTEQATFHPLAHIAFMMVDRFQIQKAALAGVAFFCDHDLNCNQFGLVGQHVDETCMWDTHKVLIIAPADVNLLFPFRIVPNDQGPNAFLNQDINQATALSMQIVVDLAVTLIREAVETTAGSSFA